MKHWLFFFCLLAGTVAAAQIKTPYNPKGNYQTISIKGMVLPYLIGNDGGAANTFGVELGFLKRHSIGIDGIFNYQSGSHDKIRDTSGTLHEVGDSHHQHEVGALVSYRFYFDFQNLRDKHAMVLYISPFVRYSKFEGFQDAAFPNDYIYQSQYQKSLGMVFGAINKFNGPHRFGIDYNVGVFYKTKETYTEYLEDHVNKTKSETGSNFGIRVGIYITYWFFVSKA